MSSKLLYASPEEADGRAAGREDAAFWSAFSQEEKISFLIRAGEMLDACMVWNGVPAVAGQELRWPRKGVLDADGMPLSETVIPEAVKHAVCEQAFFLSDPAVRKQRRFRRNQARRDGRVVAFRQCGKFRGENRNRGAGLHPHVRPSSVRLLGNETRRHRLRNSAPGMRKRKSIPPSGSVRQNPPDGSRLFFLRIFSGMPFAFCGKRSYIPDGQTEKGR